MITDLPVPAACIKDKAWSLFRERSAGFVLLVLVALCATFVEANGREITFVKEFIRVRVHGESCTLEGEYVFMNPTSHPANLSLFYPFPLSGGLPFPDSISVSRGRTNEAVPFGKVENGITFTVSIPAQKTDRYRVRYVQPTPSRRMEYILTTTRNWERPLERADFVIIIPDSFTLTHLSTPRREVVRRRHETLYRFREANFMPLENLVVEWKRRTR